MRSIGFILSAAEWRELRLEGVTGAPRVGMRFESDMLGQERGGYEVVDVEKDGALVLRRLGGERPRGAPTPAPLALTDREVRALGRNPLIELRPHWPVLLLEAEAAGLDDEEVVALSKMPRARS